MASHVIEQFICFGTDIFGLERLLRGVQAIFQIFLAYPLLLPALYPFFTASAPPSPRLTALTLDPLKAQVNITRRAMRTFNFARSFSTAYALLARAVADPQPLAVHLDIIASSLMGVFSLLETITLPDMLGVPGAALFGDARAAAINVEAQRFWFCALACAVLSGAVKIANLVGEPVPGPAPAPEGGEDWKDERERLRRGVAARKAHRAGVRRKVRALLRRMAADSLDLVIPGSVVGWIASEPGTIGTVMLCTSVLTGLDVWERCGRQVVGQQA
ncbi:hypothetical protein HYQ44_010709 [Verticillium longisporum]|nr:hypothetical protein HYQ44_010709 [Verticillium longisporum]